MLETFGGFFSAPLATRDRLVIPEVVVVVPVGVVTMTLVSFPSWEHSIR